MYDDQVRRLLYQVLFGLSVGIAVCALGLCLFRTIVASQAQGLEAERGLANPTHQTIYDPAQPYPLLPSPGPEYYANPNPDMHYPTSHSSTFPRARPVSSPAFLSAFDPSAGTPYGTGSTQGTRRSRVVSAGSNALLGIRKAPKALLRSMYPPTGHDYHYPQSSAYHTGMQGIAPMGIGYSACYGTDMSYATTSTAQAPASHHLPAGFPREWSSEDAQRRRERRSLRLVPRRAVPVLGEDIMPGGQRRGGGDPDDHITVTVEVQTSSECAEDLRSQREQLFRRDVTVGCRYSDPTCGLPQYQTDTTLPRYSAEFGRPRRRRPSTQIEHLLVDTHATSTPFCQSPIDEARSTTSPTFEHTRVGPDAQTENTRSNVGGTEVASPDISGQPQDRGQSPTTSDGNANRNTNGHGSGFIEEQ